MTPIEEYILAQPEAHQARLFALREAILSVNPGFEEKLSWGMPTFRLKHNIIHFALAKQHIGLYPGAEAVAHFDAQLADFKHSKGTIQLPHKKELPLELVKEITAWCVKMAQ